MYDHAIPFQPDYGDVWTQKLHLDLYSPFESTVFIDSDCLVVQPVEHLWWLLECVPFGVADRHDLDRHSTAWARFMRMEDVLSTYGLKTLPAFNGGFYVFDNSEASRAVFRLAREMHPHRHDIGITWASDEQLLSLAMARMKIHGVPDRGRTMRAMQGSRCRLKVDVLRGTCRLWAAKDDYQEVSPTVVHFGCGWSSDYRYRREMLRLQWFFSGSKRRRRLARGWIPHLTYFPLMCRQQLGRLRRRLVHPRKLTQERAPAEAGAH